MHMPATVCHAWNLLCSGLHLFQAADKWLFFFFYNTDEMVQSPALGSPEPHKLGWGNISGLKKTPLNSVYIKFRTSTLL